MKCCVGVALLVVGGSWCTTFAENAAPPKDDESVIRTIGEAYVRAFNGRDAKILASFWSPEAVYTNRLTGEQVVGRDAIASQFEALFETAKQLKLEVRVESIQLVSPNVAIEHGIARFLSPGAEPDEVDYSAVYVRRNGEWLLDRVTDESKQIVQSHYKQLKDLEWMIGSWVDDDDNARIITECNWTQNRSFITRSFTVSIDDRIGLTGIQFIGWAPVAEQIRSWTFDSDGGFSEGRWSKADNRWYVRKKGTTADGRSATAVNIITYVDDDVFKLRSTQRTLTGQLLPNIDEVRVVRR
jgi:uncharacterized protein (TIGR02246 family)